jgi:hypothetical protein
MNLALALSMTMSFSMSVAMIGDGPSPGVKEGGTISRERAIKIQKAARVLHRVANDSEEIADGKHFRKTLYWADRLGDLADGLEDEAGDLIRSNGGLDDEIRRSLHEVYGAHQNFRQAVQNLPDPDDRRKILKGTLKAYKDLYEAICDHESREDRESFAPPKPGPDDSN